MRPALCAADTMLWAPPSAAYGGYLDLRVLALLFCLMAVVAILQECGLFTRMAHKLLAGQRPLRLLSLVLVLLPFFSAMLLTNDVALITFVPFAILVLGLAGEAQRTPWVIALQTVAANLGSMATPVGNPQNLYLYSAFSLPAGDFFRTVLPFTALSLALLIPLALCMPSCVLRVTLPNGLQPVQPRGLALFGTLFAGCLLTVFRVLPWPVLLTAVLADFTRNWRGLLLGVNLGGLGTPVASLASLISLKLYSQAPGARPGRYLALFLGLNLLFFALLYGAALLFTGLW